jgi:plasmid stabilization system protein ParE
MLADFEYHPEAEAELDASLDWHAENRPDSARGLQESIEKAVAQAMQFPASGLPYLFATRRILLTSYPYNVVYRARDEILQIIAIAHTSRRPGYWRDRLEEASTAGSDDAEGGR